MQGSTGRSAHLGNAEELHLAGHVGLLHAARQAAIPAHKGRLAAPLAGREQRETSSLHRFGPRAAADCAPRGPQGRVEAKGQYLWNLQDAQPSSFYDIFLGFCSSSSG
jgi:hypothetical protein